MPVELEPLPPERRERSLVLASGCCTSCCCCSCCLHSVGGLVGSALGTGLAVNGGKRAPAGPERGGRYASPATVAKRARARAAGAFWISLLVTVIAAFLLTLSATNPLYAVTLVAFCLPLLQVLAGVIAIPFVLGDGADAVQAIGVIVASGVGGAAAGGVLSVVALIALAGLL